MDQQPYLSVIIPVHNTADTLQRCVDSVLNQTVTFPIEIILVENGSTDNSPELCREMAERYDCVRTITSSPAGLSLARNCGVKAARGEWVAFLDSDDLLQPDFFEALFKARDEYDADMVWCNYLNVWADGRQEHCFADTGLTVEKSIPEAVAGILLDTSTSASWNRILRKNFFDTHKFPEGVIFEDHQVMFRWVAEAGKLVHVDRPLYLYTHTGSTITSDAFTTNVPKMVEYIEANLRRLEFLDEYKGLDEKTRAKAFRHNFRTIMRVFKTMTGRVWMDPSNVDEHNRKEVERIRRIMLNYYDSPDGKALDFHTRARMFRIKHFWKRFIAKMVRREIRHESRMSRG